MRLAFMSNVEQIAKLLCCRWGMRGAGDGYENVDAGALTAAARSDGESEVTA